MRGQLNIDFSIALILFILVYVSLFVSLPSVSMGFRKNIDPLLMPGLYFSDKLISPGEPENWTDLNTATAVGLGFYNMTFYQNILDVNKVIEINGKDCDALKAKTDTTLNFKIGVETLTANYSCIKSIGSARLIERTCYVKNASDYLPAKLKIWIW